MPTHKMIFADSERSADMYYATRIFVPDPYLFVQESNGVRHVLISALEVDRARRLATVEQVHDLAEVKKRYRQAHAEPEAREADIIAFFLNELGLQMLEVPPDFPVGLADQLRERGLALDPQYGAFWPQRACKTSEEVAAIEQALVITGQGMAAGIELIRQAVITPDGWLMLEGQPLTSERVRGEIDSTLVRLGAAPQHTIVSGGDQAADPHEGGSGPLPGHRAIILDVFPRVASTGYYGDMTRTVCRGQPPARIRQAWHAVAAAQELAFQRIRPQASGREIHQALTDHLTSQGFVTGPVADGRQGGFFHGTGHGLGLEVHEPPRIGTRDDLLQVGHVVTVEPGLYYPDMGGVRLEDVVVVTEEGCRNLTTFPKFLEI